MKKLILFFFLIVIIKLIFAQDTLKSEKYKFIIKTDILFPTAALIYNLETQRDIIAFSLTFEACFMHRNSLQITGLYLYSTFNGTLGKGKELQYIPEYKYFLNGKKYYTGFFIGGFVNIINNSWIEQDSFLDENYHDTRIGGGPIIGYQNYIKRRFVIEAIFGCGISRVTNINTINNIYEGVTTGQTIYDLRFAINIGYKF